MQMAQKAQQKQKAKEDIRLELERTKKQYLDYKAEVDAKKKARADKEKANMNEVREQAKEESRMFAKTGIAVILQ